LNQSSFPYIENGINFERVGRVDKMTDVRAELKTQMAKYIVVDNALQQVNAKAQELRKEKKSTEEFLAILLQYPEIQTINTLKNDAGDTIKVQRPGTWNKGWTLSKKELESMLNTYFDKDDEPNAQECFNFIVEENKKSMVSSDFSFSRPT